MNVKRCPLLQAFVAEWCGLIWLKRFLNSWPVFLCRPACTRLMYCCCISIVCICHLSCIRFKYGQPALMKNIVAVACQDGKFDNNCYRSDWKFGEKVWVWKLVANLPPGVLFQLPRRIVGPSRWNKTAPCYTHVLIICSVELERKLQKSKKKKENLWILGLKNLWIFSVSRNHLVYWAEL